MNNKKYYLDEMYYIYDSMTHSAHIKGDIEENITVSYENNIQGKVGVYSYKAYLFDEDNDLVDTLESKIIIYKKEEDIISKCLEEIDNNYTKHNAEFIELNEDEVEIIYDLDDDSNLLVIPNYYNNKKVVSVKFNPCFLYEANIVYIPETIRNIEGIYYIRAKHIIVSKENKTFKNINNLLIKDKRIVLYPTKFNQKEITIPNGIKKIQKRCFAYNHFIKRIEMSDSIKEIEEGAFSNLLYLESIKLSNSIKEIKEKTFFNCESLKSIVLPNSLIKIGDEAFSGSVLLKELTLPSSLKKIGYESFAFLRKLNEITIPESVNTLSLSVFSGCVKLKDIYILSDNLKLKKEDFKVVKKGKYHIFSGAPILSNPVRIHIKSIDAYNHINNFVKTYNLKAKILKIE